MSWVQAPGRVMINLDHIVDVQIRMLEQAPAPDKTHEVYAARLDGIAYRLFIGTEAECITRFTTIRDRLRDVRDDQPPRSPYLETSK